MNTLYTILGYGINIIAFVGVIALLFLLFKSSKRFSGKLKWRMAFMTMAVAVLSLLAQPVVTAAGSGLQSMGVLPFGGVVYASDSPATDRVMAAVVKVYYGDRVGICDGVADDVEINAVIGTIGVGGGSVKLSNGTFQMTAPASMVSGLTFYGESYLSTILEQYFTPTAATMGVILLPSGVTDVTITHLQVDGRKGLIAPPTDEWMHACIATPHSPITQVGNITTENVYVHDANRGISLYQSGWAKITDCLVDSITGAFGEGINIDHGGNSVAEASQSVWAIVRGNKVTNCVNGIFIDSTSPDGYQKGAEVYSNYVGSCTNGITVKAPFSSVHHNKLFRVTTIGIVVLSDVSVTHNEILASGADTSLRLNGSRIVAEGNRIVAYQAVGIDVGASSLCRIVKNTLLGGVDIAIAGKFSGRNNSYIENYIYNACGGIIRISGDGVQVLNNRMSRVTFATTTSALAVIGATTLSLTSVTNVIPGEYIRISLDGGGTQDTCILDVYGSQIQIFNALTAGVAAGNAVISSASISANLGINAAAPISNARMQGNVFTGYNVAYQLTTGGVLAVDQAVRRFETHCDVFNLVLAENATYVRSNEDLSAAIPITFTIDTQPDQPRTLSGAFDSHANITAYTLVIVGKNAQGQPVSSTLTQADGWSWQTANAFSHINSITMTARTGTGVGDTIDVGIRSKLGVSSPFYAIADVFKVTKNGADFPAASWVAESTYCTIDVAAVAAIVDGDVFAVWYKTNLNIAN